MPQIYDPTLVSFVLNELDGVNVSVIHLKSRFCYAHDTINNINLDIAPHGKENDSVSAKPGS